MGYSDSEIISMIVRLEAISALHWSMIKGIIARVKIVITIALPLYVHFTVSLKNLINSIRPSDRKFPLMHRFKEKIQNMVLIRYQFTPSASINFQLLISNIDIIFLFWSILFLKKILKISRVCSKLKKSQTMWNLSNLNEFLIIR